MLRNCPNTKQYKDVGKSSEKECAMPDKKFNITSFEKVLSDLTKWLKGCPIVIIGGVATALLGQPRHTQDVDVLVMLKMDKWESIVKSAEKFGFATRISDALSFAKRNRVLLMKHVVSGVGVDISFGALPFEEECIVRAKKIKFTDFRIPIPTPEDLIIMKAVSHRGKDLIDIESIVDAHPKLDKKRIEYWVTEFAKALEMSEIWEDVKKIVYREK